MPGVVPITLAYESDAWWGGEGLEKENKVMKNKINSYAIRYHQRMEVGQFRIFFEDSVH
jgi:hypothetical protein